MAVNKNKVIIHVQGDGATIKVRGSGGQVIKEEPKK